MHEHRIHRHAGLAAALAAALTACGGGGGGGAGSATPAAAPRSTALADTRPSASLDYGSFAALRTLRSTDLGADLSRFSDPGRTYVSLVIPGASGEPQQLAFLRLSALRALDAAGGLRLDLPRHVNAVQFEVYDRQGAGTRLTGEIAR